MDVTALRMFRAVARSGSVSAAAEVVNSVQSNVSARIRKLEDTLGAPLFHRETRGMRLTPAGEVLLKYTERILALTDEAHNAIAEMMGGGGVLRMASMEMTAAAHLPPILAQFHAAFPKTKLELMTGSSETCVEAVLDRRADVAFVGGPITGVPVEGAVAFREELVLAVPSGIGVFEEAAAQTLLAFRPGCRFQDRIDAWLEERGGWPSPVLEFSSLDTVLSCVTTGMGVCIIPRKVVERPQHAGQISALSLDGSPFVDVWIIQHRDSVATRATQQFRKMVFEASEAERAFC